MIAIGISTPFSLTSKKLNAKTEQQNCNEVFPCSISSGDPTDKVVLWTKIAMEHFVELPLYFTVSEINFTRIVLNARVDSENMREIKIYRKGKS